MLVLLLALLMCQMLLDGQIIYANGKVFGGQRYVRFGIPTSFTKVVHVQFLYSHFPSQLKHL